MLDPVEMERAAEGSRTSNLSHSSTNRRRFGPKFGVPIADTRPPRTSVSLNCVPDRLDRRGRPVETEAIVDASFCCLTMLHSDSIALRIGLHMYMSSNFAPG